MEMLSAIVCVLLVSSSLAAITFDGSKSSFAEFHRWQPSISPRGTVGKLSFHFKTHLKDSLLVYQDDGRKDFLSIELSNGKILTKFDSARNSIRVEIGDELDDMNWHILEVKFTNTLVTLSLDKSFTKTANIAVTNKALLGSSGYLYMGGLPRSLSLSSLSWTQAAFKKTFVGCIKKLVMTNTENKLNRAVLVKSKGTKSGCLNECRAKNPCLHNGTCINRFSKAKCDCTGTGFEGKRCEKEIIQLYLNKNDYLIYDMTTTPVDTKSDSINIKFKTARKNGVILKTAFAHDFVVIKISKGFVVVEWDLGSGRLRMTVPNQKVNDNQWHELILKRYGRIVTASIDNGNDIKRTTPASHSRFNMYGGEGKVYVGGDGSSSRQFQGCLRKFVFNGLELVSKLKAKDPKLSVVGKVMWNCPSRTSHPTTTPPQVTRRGTQPTIKTTKKARKRPTTVHRATEQTIETTKNLRKRPTKLRKTEKCSPNDVLCSLITRPTTKPQDVLPKKTNAKTKPSKKPATEKDKPTTHTNNTTKTSKAPRVEGLVESTELGNAPTAIGLVVGSIVLFGICAVISMKLKRIRDRRSHAHQITIEHREVDEMIDSKVYQPDSYDNRS